MSLLDLYPQPMPVPVAGRAVWVAPLKIRQLARIQAAAAVAVPCPLDDVRDQLDAAAGETRRRLLRDAWHGVEAWPPAIFTAAGDAALATPAGSYQWLAIVLGEHNPDIDADELGRILAEMTGPEFGAVARVAYEIRPRDELARLIAPECFAPRRGAKPAGPLNWTRIVADVVDRTGWTLATIAELTPGQLAALRSRGEDAADFPPPPGESRQSFGDRMWAFFRKDDAA